MNIEELQARGAIFFERIDEGFRKYRDEILKMSEEEAFAFFREKMLQYGEENCFADFYYFCIDEEARAQVNGVLTEEERAYLKTLEPKTDMPKQIIFALTEPLLRIVVRLNASEMLFSTLYFVGTDKHAPMTYWGNYGQEYICFSDWCG